MKLFFLLLAVTCQANVTGPINVSVNAATYDTDNAAKVNTFGWGWDTAGSVNRAEGIRITGGWNMAVTITYDLVLVPN